MKPNAIEIKEGMNCGTCDLKSRCRFYQVMHAELRTVTICEAYTNEAKAIFGNPRKARTVCK